MAANSRNPASVTEPGSDSLFVEPYEWELFAVLRELERRFRGQPYHASRDGSIENRVRFTSDIDLGFSPGEVRSIAPPRDHQPAQVTVASFRLLGENGKLPHYLTEWIVQSKESDPLREFIDLFLQRPLSLWYELSEGFRPGAAYERRKGAADWWKFDPYAATGLRAAGAGMLPDELAGKFARVLIPLGRYAGTPVALEQAASAHLGVPVEVIPLQGGIHSDPDNGAVEADPAGRFLLRVGPMGWDRYEGFLPLGGPALMDLLHLTRLMAGPLDFDIELLLKGEEQQPCLPGRGPLLWLTSWPHGSVGVKSGFIPAPICRQLLDGMKEK